LGVELQDRVERGRPLQDDVEVGRDSGRRDVHVAVLDHRPDGGPVAVAVEERARDPTVQDVAEGGMVGLGTGLGHGLAVAAREALDAQSLLVLGATTEARVVRRVPLLQAQLGHASFLPHSTGGHPMNVAFSRRAALVAGVALPLLETWRRWAEWGQLSKLPSILDDFVAGGVLLPGGRRVARRRTAVAPPAAGARRVRAGG